ncbi:MAG: LapA family protein [Proteobacteria bacterium]|nr:LapA family protein [Pseudomonadota bacterium]
MRFIGIMLIVILIIIGIAFTALNAQMVEVNYLIGTKQWPLSAILLCCLTLGVLMSVCTMGFSLLKLKAKNKWLETKLKKAQELSTQNQH